MNRAKADNLLWFNLLKGRHVYSRLLVQHLVVVGAGLEHDRFRVAAPLADGAKVADRLVVLLLVVDEGGAVRTRPGTLVTLVGVFTRVPSSVVDQVIRSLEFLSTEVASMAKLWFVR